MIPIFEDRFSVFSISHGTEGFGKEKLDSMNNAGILHFGGHGYPDRIVDCLNGPFVKKLKISPSVVFNGACYTGVTGRWFEMFTQNGTVKENKVEPEVSFSLEYFQTI